MTLLVREHTVRALARSEAGIGSVKDLGAEAVHGDLDHVENWEQHLKGVDVLIHCASPVIFWGPWKSFDRHISVATSKLLEAAARSGVKRFVYISSESVLQDKAPLLDIDERCPYPKRANSFYGEAKRKAEEILIASKSPVEIIILRPTFIWGLGCPAFKQIGDNVRSGKFMWIDQGQVSFEAVHVENVCHAISLSLSKGKDRSIYFVTDDERATVSEFFTRLFNALKLSVPKKSLPSWLAAPLARIIEGIWKVFHIPSSPPLSRFELSFVQMPRRYDISRAKAELGYQPIKSRKAGFAEIASQSEE